MSLDATVVAAELERLAARIVAAGHGGATRRDFLGSSTLALGSLAGAGLLLAGCGETSPSGTAGPSATPRPGDVALATLHAGIEVLAINTYTAALKAATQGVFGAVPPAVSRFAATAKKQHTAHLQAWNDVITAAGKPAVTAANAAIVDPSAVAGLKTVLDVARLALRLETVAAETYVASAAQIADNDARRLALTVAPVEAQHIAVLNLVLGNYPVPTATLPVDQARTVADNR